ncbi:MAG: BsaWI family type II restriction enzyme [Dehalococcoidia bacterium]|nr:BsaWI family type II restriction enzyme [Dehalococcoidia bacterium]
MTPKDITGQLVEKFWELRPQYPSYSAAWEALQHWSEEDGRRRGLQNPGQGWNSASGGAFERVSQKIIIDQVNTSPLAQRIRVTRGDETPQDVREGILSELVWPKGQITQPERAESNVDVVAMLLNGEKPTRVISVYSCKSSAAERYQQDLYWAEKLKARGIKFCFVTIDKSLLKHATTADRARKPGKTVTLAQAMYDRVYLLTQLQIVSNPLTFKTIDRVVQDLDLWIKAY